MLSFTHACLVLAGVAACGGSPKPAAAEKSDCERGRCLEDIATAVKARRPDSRACYDARPDLPAGQITMNFQIAPDGSVVEPEQSVRRDGQLDDVEVVACIADVLKEIKFAASPAGKRTRAYHTFEFARRGK